MKEPSLIIENLKAILEECTASEDAVSYVNSEDAGTLKAAIEALEKQKPKTVRTEYDKRHNYFLHFCPVCGELTREYEYCSECGQKLSYGEEAEEEA